MHALSSIQILSNFKDIFQGLNLLCTCLPSQAMSTLFGTEECYVHNLCHVWNGSGQALVVVFNCRCTHLVIWCMWCDSNFQSFTFSAYMVSPNHKQNVTIFPEMLTVYSTTATCIWILLFLTSALPVGRPRSAHFPKSRCGTDISGCVRPSSNYSMIFKRSFKKKERPVCKICTTPPADD